MAMKTSCIEANELMYFISKFIPYYLRKRRYYRFDINGIENERLNKELELIVGKKDIVNILFIAANVPMWRGQNLYSLLDNDPRFNPRIIISPYVRYTQAEASRHTDAMKDFFRKRGLDVPATTDAGFNLDKWMDEFSPDIIFFSQHYEGLHGNRLDIEHNPNVLRCFIPYGLPTMKDQFVYNLKPHNLAWRIYHATDLHLKTAKKLMANNAVNVRIAGDADADAFFATNHHDPWKVIPDGRKRKRVIWAPHFSIIKGSGFLNRASFLWLSEAMLELARRYMDTVQFAFKPHPHLHNTLCDLENWGREKTNSYYSEWRTMPNTQLEEGKFQDLFFHSDAMIHDCGSFTGEYMFARKPVMFMTKDASSIRKNADDFGHRCLDLHFIGNSVEDAERFLVDIVIPGKDPMAKQRENFFTRYLLPPNGKTTAENIYDDIVRSLGK